MKATSLKSELRKWVVFDINIKVSPEDTNKIKSLYQSGESIFTIAKKFNVHPSTVCEHLEKSGTRRRSLKEAGILASEKGRLPNKHEIPKSSKKLTREKAYILGVMCGDGYLNRTNNDSYQVALQAIDKDFVIEFAKCIEKIYRIVPSVRKIKTDIPNWNDKWQARICSKEIYNDILDYALFGKYEWKIPGIIFNSSKNIKYSFLKGFFDSEGSVDKSKKIVAVSVNELGINEVAILLLSIGIRSNIKEVTNVVDNRRRQFFINITGREFIELYNQKINFSIKRKQTKLNNMIKNYKLRVTPHQDVEKLKSKMIELRNKGWSYQKISNELRLSISTVWRNIKK